MESQSKDVGDSKARLILQEDCESESVFAQKLILTSVENILRPTIVEKATLQELWEVLTGLIEATNESQLRLRDTFGVNEQKYKLVTRKAKALMNLNTEITLQKPKSKLHTDYLMIMLMQSLLPKYDALLDILNTKENLTWDRYSHFCRQGNRNRIAGYEYNHHISNSTAQYVKKYVVIEKYRLQDGQFCIGEKGSHQL